MYHSVRFKRQLYQITISPYGCQQVFIVFQHLVFTGCPEFFAPSGHPASVSSATEAILASQQAIVNVFSVFYLFQTIQIIFTFYIIFATLIYRLFQYYSDYFQVLLYIPSLLAGENVCYPSHCYHDYRFPDNPLSERKIRIFPVSPRYLFYHHCPFFRICIS